MRIGWDVDGPQHGFIENVNRIRRMLGQEEFKEGTWHFYRELGMTDADWVAWCNDAADMGELFKDPPLEGAVEAMQRSKELGHTNVVITDRSFGKTPRVSEELTHAWFEEHYSGLVDEIWFGADKTVVRTDMFVEDKLENYDALIDAGTDCYLIDKPWNRVKGGDMRNRIKNISEYQYAIELVTDRGYADLPLV